LRVQKKLEFRLCSILQSSLPFFFGAFYLLLSFHRFLRARPEIGELALLLLFLPNCCSRYKVKKISYASVGDDMRHGYTTSPRFGRVPELTLFLLPTFVKL